MTVVILGPEATSEHPNAESLKAALLASAPELAHPGIRLALVPQVYVKNREIDCVLVFEDSRPAESMFRTSQNAPVKSFVACVEVKNHSSDAVRCHGTHLEVRYRGAWKNATAQAAEQVWALKDFQEFSYNGNAQRGRTYVQSLLWLPRVSPDAFEKALPSGRTDIVCGDLSWQRLIDGFEINNAQGKVQTLVPVGQDNKYHSYESFVEALTAKVEPTRLDLRRVNALTQERFDADKQGYIRNLGRGLLMFRGRAGTGKTFALEQMAIHLARQGKSTRIVTYNHGLISDMARSMRIIRDRHKDIDPVPIVETRWMLMRELFGLAFGDDAVSRAAKLFDLKEREALYLRALGDPQTFLQEAIPHCGNLIVVQEHPDKPAKQETWGDICEYYRDFSAPYDFLLVDEGQDWSTEHRDLMYDVFGPGQVIVADGVDQFVDRARCDWDRGDIAKNRVVSLWTSRRTKAATCDTINDIARELDVPGWDVEPDQRLTGGRVTVLVEPQPRRALERALSILAEDLATQPKMRPVDALVCLPQTSATPGANYCNLFEAVQKDSGADYWRGYNWGTRQNREYPSRQTALRAVLYESCRGMEGWTTLCMGLDLFYDQVTAKPDIDVDGLREKLEADLFFDHATLDEKVADAQRIYALNRLMIPLTRSMDHLVIHLADAESALGRVLKDIEHDKIDWRHSSDDTSGSAHLGPSDRRYG
jgi:hypothetical protein